MDPEVVLILAGRRSFGGSILPDESVLERFCELNPDVRIYRTDHRDQEEGHTGSTAADRDHVVIRTNGDSLEATQFSNGEPGADPSCPGL